MHVIQGFYAWFECGADTLRAKCPSPLAYRNSSSPPAVLSALKPHPSAFSLTLCPMTVGRETLRSMEAFESFVALALEQEGFVVSEAIKFPVRRRTKNATRVEYQTHGYEVDLVGANANRLVLATVKSFFGSRGVVADDLAGGASVYALLNQTDIREAVVAAAADRYGYSISQVQLRFYVGRFAGRAAGLNESRVRDWCSKTAVGAGPIEVFNVTEVVDRVLPLAESQTYRDNAALVALKVLKEAKKL